MAVDRWPHFAEKVGLSKSRTDELDKILNGSRLAQTLRVPHAQDQHSISRPRRTVDATSDDDTRGPRARR